MSITYDIAAVERRVNELGGSAGSRSSTARAQSVAFRVAVSANVASLVRREAQAASVDPALVAAIARTESNFDPAARSRTGAAGIMQLMPATAQALGVENPYDPAQNVRGGALYLRELLERFGGDVRRAIAAYNAGPGAVERFGGVPPFAETKRYVERVLEAYRAVAR
ncbi:MAG: lytic transglycosylase domain-containing protein [Candidatus Eremiobacteraeota bacterium]|nr:lytic transglycosylase domain-containing protein [Candidatus Eremiobacteraeota bacterium]